MDRAGRQLLPRLQHAEGEARTTPRSTCRSRSAPRTSSRASIDLVKMKAYYFDGDNGEDVREEEIPADLLEEAKQRRNEMLETLGDFDDADGHGVPRGQGSLRRAAPGRHPQGRPSRSRSTPVFCGSALKNKGVQLLLDGVVDYLPNPTEVKNDAHDQNKNEEKVILESVADKPFVGLAFKLEDGRYGQLTYMRIYQGNDAQGRLHLQLLGGQKKVKVPRLVRMHADEMNDINEAHGRRHRRAVRRRVRLGRHVHRRQRQLHDDLDVRPGRRHLPRRVAEGEGRRGQLLEGAQPLHEGRPDVPRAPRRGVGADDHLRHGRAAPRHLRRAHEARVQAARS